MPCAIAASPGGSLGAAAAPAPLPGGLHSDVARGEISAGRQAHLQQHHPAAEALLVLRRPACLWRGQQPEGRQLDKSPQSQQPPASAWPGERSIDDYGEMQRGSTEARQQQTKR